VCRLLQIRERGRAVNSYVFDKGLARVYKYFASVQQQASITKRQYLPSHSKTKNKTDFKNQLLISTCVKTSEFVLPSQNSNFCGRRHKVLTSKSKQNGDGKLWFNPSSGRPLIRSTQVKNAQRPQFQLYTHNGL
jgi:hypothetical protein